MVSDDAADKLLDKSVPSINLLDIYSKKFSKMCEMNFSEKVWDKYKKSQKNRSFRDKCWMEEFVANLKNHNSVCSFAFKRHSVKLFKSKKTNIPVFYPSGYCTFSTGSVQFSIEVCENLQGQINFQGKWGCRDKCPNQNVLKQIRYESHKVTTPHEQD
ncbi:uncharacterized protein LOC143462255 [Clavelina lepadiformis]|uniref:uncharacterized protein LOC143462255 n=1 Tax=Clavelina lepadiformis TaxID=159417 RepID=UPI004042735D